MPVPGFPTKSDKMIYGVDGSRKRCQEENSYLTLNDVVMADTGCRIHVCVLLACQFILFIFILPDAHRELIHQLTTTLVLYRSSINS